MIRIENVNKYFNRHRANQIHVINNTSLELPEKGMVALLGPSGCGKTTLLNAMGGLDKIHSGAIYVNGQRITRRRANKIDTIRNANIGYIFQNFNLLDDQTVFENVAMALRMVGVRNRDTIQKRVNYCLEAVGIYGLRNKNAGALSGGQRQRVAIARAIVKNPKIIIADEPTGNLDSNNTLEIMNLIKKFSLDRLVILVTHEENLATFYADRIVRIKDGKVESDEENERDETLDYQLDNRIYLKDMEVQEQLHSERLSVEVFADRPLTGTIRLAVRGGNLFLDTGGKYSVIDESSDMQLINDHYTGIDQSIFESSDFDYGAYMPAKFKPRYRSIYTWWNCVVKGLGTVRKFRPLKKVLLLGFVIAAMFAFLSVSNIIGLLDVERADFMKTDEHYVTVSNPSKSTKFAKEVAKTEGVRYVIPGDSKINFTVPMDDYYQTSSLNSSITGSIVNRKLLKKDQLSLGEMPKKSREVVVDKMVLDTFLQAKAGSAIGLTTYKQFIGRKLKISGLEAFTIVGISDCQSPSIFVKKSQFTNILANAGSSETEEAEYDGDLGVSTAFDDSDSESTSKVKSYNLAPGDIKIKTGHKPQKNYEVVINNSHADDEKMKIGSTISTKMNGHTLTIVGYYTTGREGEDSYYVTKNTVALDNISKQKKLSVYADNPEELAKTLKDAGYSASANYSSERQSYMKTMWKSLKSAVTTSGIILLISLIEIYLMLRSSFLSRIKEVGTLRAIGLKKKDIYRKFSGEIIGITLITGVIGIAIMYYILKQVVKLSTSFAGIYTVEPGTAILTFLLLLLFNLLAGLLPVRMVMRKTPAQILARSDI